MTDKEEKWYVLREDFSHNVSALSDKGIATIYDTEEEAERVAKEYNNKNHHQHYWASNKLPTNALII